MVRVIVGAEGHNPVSLNCLPKPPVKNWGRIQARAVYCHFALITVKFNFEWFVDSDAA